MDIQDFIEKFAEQFEDTASDLFKADTNFKDLDEWDSLIALSVIAMADEEYGIALTGNDIRTSDSISDLFDIVCKKVA